MYMCHKSTYLFRVVSRHDFCFILEDKLVVEVNLKKLLVITFKPEAYFKEINVTWKPILENQY